MAHLIGTANNDTLNGTASDDWIEGLAGNDMLNGLGGNDTLDGGTGADTMNGGAGNDTYIVDNAGDVVVEAEVGATIARVSTAADGTQGTGSSSWPSLSSDGRYLAFYSEATNLVAGDTNGWGDGFVKDLQTGSVTRVSVAADGTQANSYCDDLSLSGDGRYVAFRSHATNLVAGDTNGRADIFVKDLQTGVVTRASTAADGSQSESTSFGSYGASLSADGRYVAFVSDASNLVAGDTNGVHDVFMKDMQTGAITRVSTAADGTQGNANSSYSSRPTISNDGRSVAFSSSASNLVAGDTNGFEDVFVKDIQTGAITRVSTAADGTQGNAGSALIGGISNDGRYVAFASGASNLVTGDTNNQYEVFVKDLQTGAITRVSTAADGTQGNSLSNGSALFADGRSIAFSSLATNLVAGDTNNSYDVFVKDLETGAITRTSAAGFGTQGNANSIGPVGSADGRYVAFTSNATNLVAGDTNGVGDVFVAPVIRSGGGDAGGTDEVQSSISYTLGANVENLTLTGAGNINGTGNTLNNVITGNSAANVLDGGVGADTLIGGAGNDTYVVDNVGNAVTENAGEGTDSVQSSISYTLGANVENLTLTGAGNTNGTGNSLNNVITGNGGANLLDGGAGADTMSGSTGDDTFVVDNAGDVVTESAGAGTETVQSSISYALGANLENLTLTGTANINGTGTALNNVITGNSAANLLSGGAGNDTLYGGDGNDTLDGGTGADTMNGTAGNGTYIVDNVGDAVVEGITRVSTAADGTPGNSSSGSSAIAANGRYVAFSSAASNLGAGDTNGGSDIFVKDVYTGAITRVSTAADGTQGNSSSGSSAIAANGRYVAFSSAASNLVAGDTNGGSDIFVKDVYTGAITRVSTAADGTQGNSVSSGSWGFAISADGRYVAFDSYASNLVAGDTNGTNDIFVKDMHTGAITRVSTAADGTQGNGFVYGPAISADGRYVAFESAASNLVAGDTNGNSEVFVKDLQTGAITRVSTAADGTQANSYGIGFGGSSGYAISPDGRYVAFHSNASNLVAGDTNGVSDVFVKDLQTGAITRVSTAADGTQAGGFNQFSSGSVLPEISADGRYVAFSSDATNLVAGDTNNSMDVFVKDLQTGAIARVSSEAGAGFNGAMSADGRWVAFEGAGGVFVEPVTFGDGEAGGTDTVQSSVSYALSAGVENLLLTGTASISGDGNGLNNVITGNSGANLLAGGAGNDILDGQGGIDSAVFSYPVGYYRFGWSGSQVTVSGPDGVDTLTNIEQLNFANLSFSIADRGQVDPLFYLNQNSDVAAAGIDPLTHYRSGGWAEGRDPNPNVHLASVNGLEYIASYGDLMGAFGLNKAAGYQHFASQGVLEGRSISFDGLEYIASYGDLMNAFGANADAGAGHYIQAGRFEGRHSSFDGLEYIASYGDLIGAFSTNADAGTSHYIQGGRFEGRSTNFDGLEYIASHGDLINAFHTQVAVDPDPDIGATHYILAGYGEGRVADQFNAAQYLANYADLQAVFQGDTEAATLHYITAGYFEGRTDHHLG